MQRRSRWLGLVCLGLLGVVSGCATDETGVGYLDVADLGNPPLSGNFTGKAVALNGKLALRPNGCVTVVVDGVERVPLWPDGTDVSDVSKDPERSKRYVVKLPGGLALAVDQTTGAEFSAVGVIDDNSGPFEREPDDPPGKVASFLAFCEVKDPPVAFKDATTFAVRGA
jgi:hypothetical protein